MTADKFLEAICCAEPKAENLYQEQKGKFANEDDLVWSISNQLLDGAMKNSDWQKMKMIYWAQAMFLHESKKSCFRVLQEASKCELRNFQKSGVIEKVEIVTCKEKSCHYCQEQNGKIFTIKEALEKMPIPHQNCTYKLESDAPDGWCRCCYIANFDGLLKMDNTI